jgi:predicted SAM-dependent methyltransferase
VKPGALLRRVAAGLRQRLDVLVGPTRLRWAARRRPLRIVVGASAVGQRGWVATEARYLDLTQPGHWATFFTPRSIDAILAEHVWEHLAPAGALQAARTCATFLAPHGRLRIAVPDGNHPDPSYIEWVRPGGTGPGSDDHQVLYTIESLSALLESSGFTVKPLEWHDAAGVFHREPWSPEDGFVRRSARWDPRNAGGALRYTSLIVDAFPAVAASG